MYLRIELFGLFLELGALDRAADVPAETLVGDAPSPIDADAVSELPAEHLLPLGFHQRAAALGDEDV